ncbi:dihydrolipoyl dehydrogenase [Thiopseudomonas alkaliphila]|uniref:dihydrolipoyl dehydrogenase n=1 Tax=Thiopseudomonas alkaliphila TaxID=1697053 RepID=UPI00069E0998|nr:dihydrolipoyl dehydrogenase [Thiopseudomonas alkaliphila]AKX50166.1 dihydrolipoamide dehydrogenase [Thiopseudomonas alkaliphila]AKX54509.1 dihydrolipoamide dehydrogenase [Thiopseudomonas alkaliphila]AKX56502.1 dihydrolipoamide dehydrogenase [Thiopseudomonas alkaliphila]
MQTKSTDVLIIGAGTAGLYALREVKRAKKDYLVVDTGPLGTTCARVGCMPSKVLLQVAQENQALQQLVQDQVITAKPQAINDQAALKTVRQLRDRFATGAAQGAQRAAGEHLIIGKASFLSPNRVQVMTAEGQQVIEAHSIILATGSSPVVPSFLSAVADRMLTTDAVFELEHLPKRLGVMGLGAIGLELGLALARLGVQVTAADMADQLGGIQDPTIAQAAQKIFSNEMDIWLGHPAEVERTEHGVLLKAGNQAVEVDQLLVALGRKPNLAELALEKAGLPVDEKGVPLFDPHTMQIGDTRIFIAGDLSADRTLMHEACDEGAIAGYNASRTAVTAFERKVPLAIAFTQPDIVSVGASFHSLTAGNYLVGEAKANGRAIIKHDEQSLIRLYADSHSGKLLGASLLGVDTEHLGHFLALAIMQQMTVADLLQAPYYHPVVEEQLQAALQDLLKQLPQLQTGLPFGLTQKS